MSSERNEWRSGPQQINTLSKPLTSSHKFALSSQRAHAPSKCISLLLITSPTGAVAKYCDEYVCVCLSATISPEPHARSLPSFCACCLCPWLQALSSCDMFTIGRIAHRRAGVFFPVEKALSVGKGDGSAERGRSMLSTIALLKLSRNVNVY